MTYAIAKIAGIKLVRKAITGNDAAGGIIRSLMRRTLYCAGDKFFTAKTAKRLAA